MIGEAKKGLEDRLLSAGITKKETTSLMADLAGFDAYSSRLLDDINNCADNLEMKDRATLYRKSIGTLSGYAYPDSRMYLSKKLFLEKRKNVLKDLDVLSESYMVYYINFLDLAYKHSKGVEFLSELLSTDVLSDKSAKESVRKDAMKRGLDGVLPNQVYSAIY